MRDLYSNLDAVEALSPAVHTATVNGSVVDLKDAGGVLVALTTGAVAGSGDFGAKLQESADGSTWADVPAKWVDDQTLDVTLNAGTCYRIGYRGKLRFVRLVLVKAGGTSIAAAAVAVLRPHLRPVA